MPITRRNNVTAVQLSVFLLGAIAISVAMADDDAISPDRPDFVESSDAVARAIVQIETGINYERDDHPTEPTRTYTTPTLVRYGIGSGVELRLETDGRIDQRTQTIAGTNSETGMADLSLGLKWHFQDGDAAKHQPSMAILLHADIASGSSAFHGEGIRPSLRGVAEWEFGESNSIGVMPGIFYDQLDGRRFWSGIFAITTSHQLTGHLRGFMEVAAQQLAHAADGGNIITYDAGLMYSITKSIQVDCYVSRGANDNTPNWNFGGGMAIRF